MSGETTVVDMKEGESFAPFTFTVTPEINQQYCYGMDDFHPRYVTGENDKPPLAHPALLLHMSGNGRSPIYRHPPGVGSLHAKDRVRFRAPAYVGNQFHVTFQIKNLYEKRGKHYRDVEILMKDEQGTLVLERIATMVLKTKK